MPIQTVRIFLSLLFLLFYGGCALQSSLVDLEGEVRKTRETEQELRQLGQKFEALIQSVGKTPANNSEGMVILLGKINLLEEQLQRLEGRLEEEGHKTADALRRMDDQADQVNRLLVRTSLLEKQVITTATTSPQVMPMGSDKKGNGATEGTPDGGKVMAPNSSSSPSAELGMRVSPQEAYRLAYNDYLSGKYSLAIINFKNYIAQYPDSVFLPEAIYWMGQSYYSQGFYHEAVNFFKQMAERYPMHELVPNAWLKMALAYVALNETHSAKTFFTKLIERFPQSDAALRAKGELSALNSAP